MRDLTEREKLANEAGRDTVKHLVTLATASIGVLLAVFKALLGETDKDVPWQLWAAFACFGASCLGGMLALQSLTGNLEKREEPSNYSGNVVGFQGAQVLGFVAGLALAVASIVSE